MKRFLLIALLPILLLSCRESRYAATNRVYKKQVRTYARLLKEYPVRDSFPTATPWVGTTNFSMRRPNFVIIHHTAQNSCDQTLKTFTLTRTQVSSHYVICKDGTVHHMLHDLLRGHHAGVSRWGNTTDLNSSSVGIEIDNNGFEPFTDPQIESLLRVLDRLKKAFSIPTGNFIGHADIAPGRKVDPSRYFPWQRLAQNGFGHWYDTTGLRVPPAFEPMQALRVIGYDIRNAGNAIQSYKIHFARQDTTRIITDDDRKILYDLMRKYQ
ncbi:MAG: hypothetical protein RJA57_1987 [Bacteroidota bacterium]|jgi:N-acetylmuramoyl-L-alanine amidase